ncbi:hypothetical protein LQZ18_07810 [Lachnospiraceae bacterium ZAX-1]
MFKGKDFLKIRKKALAFLMAMVMVASMELPFEPTIVAEAAESTGCGSNGKFLAPIDEADPKAIEISNAVELAKIGMDESYPLDGSYALGTDIDLSGKEWKPIGMDESSAFTGFFDGQGHVIKGMTITGNVRYAGLFGYVRDATVKNVGMEDGYIDVSNTDAGAFAGGIAGFNVSNSGADSLSYSNCYNMGGVAATVTATTPYIGITLGNADAEGITGYSNGGSYSNCYNMGGVAATGVSAGVYANAGGITGTNFSFSSSSSPSCSNCYNMGEIVATATSSSARAGG